MHQKGSDPGWCGGLLERAAELSALDEALASVRASGHGRLVLLSGEAGIGKTSLLRAFCAGHDDVATFRGGCDPLFTPRPLAPFVELADAAGGRLAARLARGTTPADVVAALVEELPRRAPALLAVEDLHWADEATLDVVRLLGRRLESLPLLVMLSYRDEHVDRDHPLRIVLGDLAAAGTLRLALAPLSADAIAALAGDETVDAGALARRTGGNPFFVTEVLAAGGAEVPATVRDAVLGRAARLGPPARRILDAVSIFPPRAELRLLEECVPGYPEGLDECLVAGMLHPEGAAVAFRHEIARFVLDAELCRTTGWRSTARPWRRSHGRFRPTRPGWPTTPRAPATATRCCAGRRWRRSGRRRSARTARPPSSTPAPCGRRMRSRPSAGPSCTSAAPTSAT
ncbi:MAG TPA: AAA family ATPase [Gaiellales bacterium]|nr:AAA family ATPase [Gaiellales bacterium]